MAKEQVWDFWARDYEKLWVQKYSLQPTRREVINQLKDILKEDRSYKILDIGCGIGQLLLDIQGYFDRCQLELTGIDFSQGMINKAKANSKNIRYLQMDVSEIRSLTETFDIIICTHSFPYYQDQRKVVEIFYHLLRPQGHLLLAQASQNTVYDKLILAFVKLTTGKAHYPSIKAMKEIASGYFHCQTTFKIKEKYFMPSIYLFVFRGKG